MNNKKIYKASFSQVDITPNFQVELIGGNSCKSQGILDKLFAQILLFENDNNFFYLITIDNLGLSTQLANTLRTKVASQLNAKISHIMLNFSHTHAAPCPDSSALNGDLYFHFMCEQIMQCVENAKTRLIPCKGGWSLTTTNIGDNRRDGCTIVDNRLGALKLVDSKSRNPIVVILRITAHANVLMGDNQLISSDYFGKARQVLENYFSCPVMLIQGAAGNIKPTGVDKMHGGNISDIKRIVDILKNSVTELYFDIQDIVDIQMLSKEVKHYSDVPTETEALKISINSEMDASNWLSECERLRNAHVKEQFQQSEVQFLKINNGCLCGVPEEIFCEISLDAAVRTHNPLLFLNGYTNGCTGYLPTKEEWRKGGFETLYSYLIYFPYHGHVMPFRENTADNIVELVTNTWGEISLH
ncbi:neutral/alkaline non-lysosomal ceramidase N-terminal domain-containing protein [Clostridium sp. CTA-5]